MFSLRLIEMQCCVFWGGGAVVVGGGGRPRPGVFASDRQSTNSEPCACWAVSSDSSHHPVQPVCAQIVLNIYYYNGTALCKSIISGRYALPSRALAGGERRFRAGNINRTLFNLFNLASLG